MSVTVDVGWVDVGVDEDGVLLSSSSESEPESSSTAPPCFASTAVTKASGKGTRLRSIIIFK